MARARSIYREEKPLSEEESKKLVGQQESFAREVAGIYKQSSLSQQEYVDLSQQEQLFEQESRDLARLKASLVKETIRINKESLLSKQEPSDLFQRKWQEAFVRDLACISNEEPSLVQKQLEKTLRKPLKKTQVSKY